MSALLPICSTLSTLWIASLWQGLALAVATTLLLHTMPTLTPRLRYRVWAAGYAAAILLPLAQAAQRFGALRNAHDAAISISAAAASAPLVTIDSRWTLLCAALWAAAAFLAVLRLGAGLWSVRRLLRSSLPLQAPAAYTHLLQLRSRGRVTVLASGSIETPVATGYLKPAIVLPRALSAGLTDEQLEQVLRHELEHLARRDDWASLLFGCMRCLFPLNPALAFFERRLVATREMACDDAVLRTAAPRVYAMNLARIAETTMRRSPRILPNLLGAQSQLAGRIEHILSSQRDDPAKGGAPLFAAAAAMLALCALLAHSPAPVAFESRSSPAPALATTSMAAVLPSAGATPAPAAVHPHVRKAAARVRHAHPAATATHLLAEAHQTANPLTVNATASAPSPALLILWGDPQHGFSATVVFALGRVEGAADPSRQNVLFFNI